MLGFLRDANTSQSVIDVFDYLYITNDNFVDKESEEYMKSFILEGTLNDPKIVTFSNPRLRISEIESQDF